MVHTNRGYVTATKRGILKQMERPTVGNWPRKRTLYVSENHDRDYTFAQNKPPARKTNYIQEGVTTERKKDNTIPDSKRELRERGTPVHWGTRPRVTYGRLVRGDAGLSTATAMQQVRDGDLASSPRHVGQTRECLLDSAATCQV